MPSSDADRTSTPSVPGSNASEDENAQQITWKFFSSACNAYQLDVLLSRSSTGLQKGQGREWEVKLNGQLLLAARTDQSLKKGPAQLQAAVDRGSPCAELRGYTFHITVERAGSKLKAAARVGTNAASLQLLRTPEIACLATQPSQRELSWPIIVGSSSFLISLTLFTGKGIARLAVNGFILMEKSLGMFAQMPFRSHRLEAHIDEGGLGEMNGCKVTVLAKLSKDGGIKGLALLDSKLLAAPQTFSGRRFAITPLRQRGPVSASNPAAGRAVPPDTPQGWTLPHPVAKSAASSSIDTRSSSDIFKPVRRPSLPGDGAGSSSCSCAAAVGQPGQGVTPYSEEDSARKLQQPALSTPFQMVQNVPRQANQQKPAAAEPRALGQSIARANSMRSYKSHSHQELESVPEAAAAAIRSSPQGLHSLRSLPQVGDELRSNSGEEFISEELSTDGEDATGMYMGTPDSACSMDARMRHPSEDPPHPGEHLLAPNLSPRSQAASIRPLEAYPRPQEASHRPLEASPVLRGMHPFPRGQRHSIHSATLPSVVAKRQVVREGKQAWLDVRILDSGDPLEVMQEATGEIVRLGVGIPSTASLVDGQLPHTPPRGSEGQRPPSRGREPPSLYSSWAGTTGPIAPEPTQAPAWGGMSLSGRAFSDEVDAAMQQRRWPPSSSNAPRPLGLSASGRSISASARTDVRKTRGREDRHEERQGLVHRHASLEPWHLDSRVRPRSSHPELLRGSWQPSRPLSGQLTSQRSSTSQHDRSPSLHDSPGAVSIPSVYRESLRNSSSLEGRPHRHSLPDSTHNTASSLGVDPQPGAHVLRSLPAAPPDDRPLPASAAKLARESSHRSSATLRSHSSLGRTLRSSSGTWGRPVAAPTDRRLHSATLAEHSSSLWSTHAGEEAASSSKGLRRAHGRSHRENVVPETWDDRGAWLINRRDVRIARTSEGKRIRIGEGGNSVVYKAIMHEYDEVALKLVRMAQPSQAELQLFEKEVMTLRLLRHRNIVQFYGACLEPDCLFIVTELLAGGDMYTVLKTMPEVLAWDRLGARIALDVALGLAYLHSRKPAMLHRDLKSPNVLLTREGVAKIADVGLMQAQIASSITAQGAWTPLWAAPEVFRHERATLKADIWSFGIILFELASLADVAQFPALGIASQIKDGNRLRLPSSAPPIVHHLFHACTCLVAEGRPSAVDIVNLLRKA